MALSSSIFHPSFTAHHQPAVKSSMRARIRIERVLAVGTWNAATGLYEGASTRVLYLGVARLQKVARPTRREFVFDSADNQMMRLQLPFDGNEATPGAFSWQSNDQVTVLANQPNAMMIGQLLFVKGWAGSSNDWAHTLHCGFNAKQDGS